SLPGSTPVANAECESAADSGSTTTIHPSNLHRAIGMYASYQATREIDSRNSGRNMTAAKPSVIHLAECPRTTLSNPPAAYVIGRIVLVAAKLLNLPITETHAWHAFAGGILAMAQ